MKSQILCLALLFVSATFGWFLYETLNVPKYSFSINETVEVSIDRERTFFLLCDSPILLKEEGSAITVIKSTIYSLLQLDGQDGLEYEFFAKMKNLDLNQYIYLSGHSDQTTVTVQSMRSLGKYSLQQGTYELLITPASINSLANQDDYSFMLYPTSLILNFALLMFSGAAMVVLIGFIIVFYLQKRIKKEEKASYNNDSFGLSNDD